jgi:hypothetical protein
VLEPRLPRQSEARLTMWHSLKAAGRREPHDIKIIKVARPQVAVVRFLRTIHF